MLRVAFIAILMITALPRNILAKHRSRAHGGKLLFWSALTLLAELRNIEWAFVKYILCRKS